MALVNSLATLVAGRANVHRSEQRSYERKYQDLEERLKKVTDVAPEPTPSLSESRSSIISRPISSIGFRSREGTLRSSRPELGRCQSEIASPSFSIKASPSGPPDLSAVDLTTEQLKRTYSNDDVWDIKKDPLPPLPIMKGFAGYRRSAIAERGWQTETLRKKFSDLNPAMIDKLGDFEVAELDEGILEDLKINGFRRSSEASSQSALSDVSALELEHSQYISGGTRVYRGFAPSTESSAASSLKDSVAYLRKDSVLSVTGIGGGVDRNSLQKTTRQSSIRSNEDKSLTQLSTISELHGASKTNLYKIERPCQFEAGGDPDSALASDESDDEDQDWSDVAEIRSSGPGISALTRMVHESRTRRSKLDLVRTRTNSSDRTKQRSMSNFALERTKAMKGPVFAQHRRRQSRTKLPLVRKVACEENDHTKEQEPKAQHSESTVVAASSTQNLAQANRPLSRMATLRHDRRKPGDNTNVSNHRQNQGEIQKVMKPPTPARHQADQNTLNTQECNKPIGSGTRNRSSTAFRLTGDEINYFDIEKNLLRANEHEVIQAPVYR